MSIGRFTTLLIPIWAAAIGVLLASGVERLRQATGPGRKGYWALALLLGLLMVTYPVESLLRYYNTINETHESGRALLELSRYAVAQNEDEPVYISTIEELSFLRGIPYVPHAAFLLGDIHHEFLPPRQIVGRLFENPGAALLLLSDRDAGIVQETARLQRVAIPANEEAKWRSYGLYRLDTNAALHKPDSVLRARDVPGGLAPTVTVGEGTKLLGCDVTESLEPGDRLSLHCYWQAIEAMPQGIYVGFAHLFDPATLTLVAQDDHAVGQELYPLNAWQSDEVVRESYEMDIPDDASPGEYQLWVGIYTWPSLSRLSVPDSSDNVVILPSVRVAGQK